MVSAAPFTNLSQLNWGVLGEPTVWGHAVIDSNVVSSNSFEDAKCGYCSAFSDANSAAHGFSQLKVEKLDEPVLCSAVPGLVVINSSDDIGVRHLSKDEKSGSSGVSADANSAAPATNFSHL